MYICKYICIYVSIYVYAMYICIYLYMIFMLLQVPILTMTIHTSWAIHNYEIPLHQLVLLKNYQVYHHLLIVSSKLHPRQLLQRDAEQGAVIHLHLTAFIYLLNQDNFSRNRNYNLLPIGNHPAHHQNNQNHVLLPITVKLIFLLLQ